MIYSSRRVVLAGCSSLVLMAAAPHALARTPVTKRGAQSDAPSASGMGKHHGRKSPVSKPAVRCARPATGPLLAVQPLTW
jgi:hypothetical protein